MTFWEWVTSLFGHKTTTTTTKMPINTTTTTTKIPANTTTTTTTSSGNKTRRCLAFSINDYPGTQNDLRGCNADSQNWADLLKNQYGFEVKRIIDSSVTTANIKKEMLNLITTSKSGDALVFTYSGHGTTVVNEGNDYEPTGKDQALYLYDGPMVDDDIRDILNQLPQGVKLTVILDSCFSGTCTREFLKAMNDMSYYSMPKYMPPSDNVEAIRLMGLPTIKGIVYPEEGMNHILISGTDDHSYSYDANIGGQPCGAFSYYAIKAIKENPNATYKDFYAKLNTYLPSSEYPQHPQLEGSEANKNTVLFV